MALMEIEGATIEILCDTAQRLQELDASYPASAANSYPRLFKI